MVVPFKLSQIWNDWLVDVLIPNATLINRIECNARPAYVLLNGVLVWCQPLCMAFTDYDGFSLIPLRCEMQYDTKINCNDANDPMGTIRVRAR